MGLKVTTDGKPVTVYRQDKTSQAGNPYTTYCIGVSSKDSSGNWVNGFQNCLFKKGVDLNHKTKIEIKNSFFTVNEYNGTKSLKLFILDFVVVENGEQPQENNGNLPMDEQLNFVNMPDAGEELPFK